MAIQKLKAELRRGSSIASNNIAATYREMGLARIRRSAFAVVVEHCPTSLAERRIASCTGSARLLTLALTYVIDADARIVSITVTGPTSAQDIADLQARLRDDPSFQPSYHQLFDFRAARLTDIFAPQVEALLTPHRLPSPHGGPTSSRRAA